MHVAVLLMFICGALAVAAAGVALWLQNKNQVLDKRLKTLKEDLDRTSKILIEKNLELSDQNVQQQKLLESKDDFIGIVSHQLRTPITEIKWSLQAILTDAAWVMQPEQRATIKTLFSSVERLIRLINDILAMVSVEQGAVRLAVGPYNLDVFVQDVAQRVAKDFTDKHIQQRLDLQYAGELDSINTDSMGMVLSNILENAYQYTPQGGVVEVRTRANGDMCEISIIDTGIGISEDQQKNMFIKFRRSEEAILANVHGSGLGLYIVKNILARHGGAISFHSAKGKGTTFVCTVPAHSKK